MVPGAEPCRAPPGQSWLPAAEEDPVQLDNEEDSAAFFVAEQDDPAALADSRETALREQLATLTAELARAHERFDLFASTLPGLSWECWGHPYTGIVNYVSRSAEALTGYTVDEWQEEAGFALRLIHPADRERVLHETDASFARGDTQGSQDYRLIHKDGTCIELHVRYSILRDEVNQLLVWQAFSLDVTAQRQAEAARDRAQAELIAAQDSLLSQLSTPLIPILDGVVAMPLIGRIDLPRAQRMLEVLLEGITRTRARYAILDITGVPTLDAAASTALRHAAQACRLLGVRLLLTGIRAEVARELGPAQDALQHVTTLASLQDGVRHVLSRGAR